MSTLIPVIVACLVVLVSSGTLVQYNFPRTGSGFLPESSFVAIPHPWVGAGTKPQQVCGVLNGVFKTFSCLDEFLEYVRHGYAFTFHCNGPCPPAQSNCAAVKEPICASNLVTTKTFSSSCAMGEENYRTGSIWFKISTGPCPVLTTSAAPIPCGDTTTPAPGCIGPVTATTSSATTEATTIESAYSSDPTTPTAITDLPNSSDTTSPSSSPAAESSAVPSSPAPSDAPTIADSSDVSSTAASPAAESSAVPSSPAPSDAPTIPDSSDISSTAASPAADSSAVPSSPAPSDAPTTSDTTSASSTAASPAAESSAVPSSPAPSDGTNSPDSSDTTASTSTVTTPSPPPSTTSQRPTPPSGNISFGTENDVIPFFQVDVANDILTPPSEDLSEQSSPSPLDTFSAFIKAVGGWPIKDLPAATKLSFRNNLKNKYKIYAEGNVYNKPCTEKC